MSEDEASNYTTFRECLSGTILQHLASPTRQPTKKRRPKGRKKQIKPVEQPAADDDVQDAEELSEFIEYLASDIFPSLPTDLRTLTYAATRNDPFLHAKYAPPIPLSTLETLTALLPPTTTDSLLAYGLLTPSTTPTTLLAPLISAYVTAVTTPPPSFLPSTSRAQACELCDRDWIPLTYHHLIPRSVHAKVVKRGWHEEWRLNSVAWLCRACHSFVHGIGSNEELAREWYTVELLRGREDVVRWVRWVGKVRWKAR